MSPQATSRSSDRHPPTFRWPPPLGWSWWYSYSPCSRCTLPSGPSSETRREVSPHSACPGLAQVPHPLTQSIEHLKPQASSTPTTWQPALPAVQPMASCPGCGQGVLRERGAGQGHGLAHPHGLAGSGLCGTFNGDTTDDFMSSTGIVEGTAALFVDSWRAGNCPTALERETDPCSMSQLNSECPAPGRLWEWAGGSHQVGGRPMPSLSPQRYARRPTARSW